jgi:hypothetical protein
MQPGHKVQLDLQSHPAPSYCFHMCHGKCLAHVVINLTNDACRFLTLSASIVQVNTEESQHLLRCFVHGSTYTFLACKTLSTRTLIAIVTYLSGCTMSACMFALAYYLTIINFSKC